MGQVFVHDQLVRFCHCDPAGIVFFPRFFDLAHNTMEDWFASGLGLPLPDMIRDRRVGSPTVSIQCDFKKTLRMGDTLRFALTVTRTGRSSVGMHYAGTKGDDSELHLSIEQTLVFMDLDRQKAIPIPEDLKPRIERFLRVPG